MKPTPQYEFPLSVRRQSWEEEPEVAALYEGIFDVLLNHIVSVMFVPACTQRSWPPALPEIGSEVMSVDAAREQCIALARYSVTADNALAGTERTFARDGDELAERVVFFVTNTEFAEFSMELARLADGRPSVHSEWAHREVAGLAVTQFLVCRFLHSSRVSKYDLKMLGR